MIYNLIYQSRINYKIQIFLESQNYINYLNIEASQFLNKTFSFNGLLIFSILPQHTLPLRTFKVWKIKINQILYFIHILD